MIGGLLCYFHWEAMLISHLAKVKKPIPFSNLQELYKSSYRLTTLPGSAYADFFKNGDELRQLIYKEKLELGDQICSFKEECTNWLIQDEKNAFFYSYNIYA